MKQNVESYVERIEKAETNLGKAISLALLAIANYREQEQEEFYRLCKEEIWDFGLNFDNPGGFGAVARHYATLVEDARNYLSIAELEALEDVPKMPKKQRQRFYKLCEDRAREDFVFSSIDKYKKSIEKEARAMGKKR
jgi:hypothetical protein